MPIFGGSLLFLHQQIRHGKGSSKKSDKQGLKNMPTPQSLMGKLVKKMEWMLWVLPFLAPLLLLTLTLLAHG